MAGRVAGASLLRTLQRLPGVACIYMCGFGTYLLAGLPERESSAFQGEAATSVARSFAGHGFSALAGSSAAAPSSSAFSLQGRSCLDILSGSKRDFLPASLTPSQGNPGRKWLQHAGEPLHAAGQLCRDAGGDGCSPSRDSLVASGSISVSILSVNDATRLLLVHPVQARNSLPFSFAAHMHSLGRKDDEQGSPVIAGEVPKVPTALSALPPKPK
eukprot:scaffold141108_cov19-Tisochrysis_lutea.AAC.4